MKTALVTGSAGFVGRHITRHLDADGWGVYRYDTQIGLNAFTRFASKTTEKYDLIVHAAAAGPNRRAIDTEHGNFPYNVMLDAALFEWAIRTRQPRVVYLSSCAIYPAILQDRTGWRTTGDRGFMGDRRLYEAQAFDGDPFDSYGHTKMIGERMAQRYAAAGGIAHIVRPFSGYGEDQSEDFPFRAFVERAKRREDPFAIWGNSQQVRDWIHIDDICAAIFAIVDADFRIPVNLCTGVGTNMLSLVGMICNQISDYEPRVQVDHKAPMGVFYRVGDPVMLNTVYVPRITIEEGVQRAFQL